MTGIERLRDIAEDRYSGGMIHISVQRLREICEQIEREVDDISGMDSGVLAADGKPLEVGQTVYHIADGKEYTVEELFKDGAMVTPDGITGGRCSAEYLTHERPDSWERWIEDADKSPCEYFGYFGTGCDGCQHDPCMCENDRNRDLVRRGKALAERASDETAAIRAGCIPFLPLLPVARA